MRWREGYYTRGGQTTMTTRTLQAETVAEAYLELLRDRGIEYFLGNAGTDFASLVDAFAKFEAQGHGGPKPLVVPHEMVAVSMAHGYYLGAGRPAAVAVPPDARVGPDPGAAPRRARRRDPRGDPRAEVLDAPRHVMTSGGR